MDEEPHLKGTVAISKQDRNVKKLLWSLWLCDFQQQLWIWQYFHAEMPREKCQVHTHTKRSSYHPHPLLQSTSITSILSRLSFNRLARIPFQVLVGLDETEIQSWVPLAYWKQGSLCLLINPCKSTMHTLNRRGDKKQPWASTRALEGSKSNCPKQVSGNTHEICNNSHFLFTPTTIIRK